MTTTTAENITTKQIKALREEALVAGDYRMVDICAIALTMREDHDEQTAEPLLGPDGDRWTRTEARAECARAIAAAEAQGYRARGHAELREWARTVNPGEYLVTYEECGLDADADPGSRCGYDDPTHDQISKWLAERNLRLDTDDVGLVVHKRETE